mmetsp:Transcript_3132/g.3843  ORF Transcript_3132/g.3843 Transcript_3132/m.3843 type:complete len:120 (+) Transcript_3132:339-698(+)
MGGACSFTIQKSQQEYNGIQLKGSIFKNITASVYKQTSYQTFEQVHYFADENDSIKIDVGGYNSVIVVAASDDTRIGAFEITASLYKDPLSPGAIAGIVAGSVAFLVIVIIIVVCCIRC